MQLTGPKSSRLIFTAMATIFDQEVLNSFKFKCEAIRRFPLGAWAHRVCRLVRTGFAIDLPPDVEFNEMSQGVSLMCKAQW